MGLSDWLLDIAEKATGWRTIGLDTLPYSTLTEALGILAEHAPRGTLQDHRRTIPLTVAYERSQRLTRPPVHVLSTYLGDSLPQELDPLKGKVDVVVDICAYGQYVAKDYPAVPPVISHLLAPDGLYLDYRGPIFAKNLLYT